MSEYAPRPPILQDMSHKEGLIIVAAVACLLIGLVILRFGCNIAIDVCILRDLAAARRTIRDFFPCWRMREHQDDEEQQQVRENEIAVADMNSLMLRLTTQEKSLLIGSILKSKVSFVVKDWLL